MSRRHAEADDIGAAKPPPPRTSAVVRDDCGDEGEMVSVVVSPNRHQKSQNGAKDMCPKSEGHSEERPLKPSTPRKDSEKDDGATQTASESAPTPAAATTFRNRRARILHAMDDSSDDDDDDTLDTEDRPGAIHVEGPNPSRGSDIHSYTGDSAGVDATGDGGGGGAAASAHNLNAAHAENDDDEETPIEAYRVQDNDEAKSVYEAKPINRRRKRIIIASFVLLVISATVVSSVVLSTQDTILQTNAPSLVPSSMPSSFPSHVPSDRPSLSQAPSFLPSTSPSLGPSSMPSPGPSSLPSSTPTVPILWSPLGEVIEGEFDGDRAGRSIALSGNGKVVAIGAPTNDGDGPYGMGDVEDTGSVRVFEYIEATNRWILLGQELNGVAVNDQFGFSVALSDDGTILAVGSDRADSANGEDSGIIRVYRYLSERNSWMQLGQNLTGEASDDRLGWRGLALSSDGMIVAGGAFQNDRNGTAIDGGSVRVYEYLVSTDEWAQLGMDIDGVSAGDGAGSSVSLSSSGEIVAIGAYESGVNDSGSARILEYDRAENTWISVGNPIFGEGAGDNSGFSVSLSSTGLIVAVGAHRNVPESGLWFAGHIRVYEFDASINDWAQRGDDVDGLAADDRFGYSVSLSADGNIVAIGAAFMDANGADSGAALIYEYRSMAQAWALLGDIIDGESASDGTGHSVSLSSDGTVVAVGSPFSRRGTFGDTASGHVSIYELQGKSLGTTDAPTVTLSPDANLPAPTTSPAPTAPPSSTLSPTSATVAITVKIQLDRFPRETSWSLESLDGDVTYASAQAGSYTGLDNQQITETINVAHGEEYRFIINDSRDNGTNDKAGYYAIFFGEETNNPEFLLVFEAEFTDSRDEVTFKAIQPKEVPSFPLVPNPTPSFVSIANVPGATRLNKVSDCESCIQFITLPFVFYWMGDTPITTLTVGSDGQIDIHDDLNSFCRCYIAQPVVVGGEHTMPRIAVAQQNLDPEVSGDIWTLFTGDAFIISWEDVQFHNFAAGTGLVNAQAVLYPNGSVDICYGDGHIPQRVGFNDKNIASGLEDDSRSVPLAFPATGAPFGEDGITLNDEWPANQCRIFHFDDGP